MSECPVASGNVAGVPGIILVQEFIALEIGKRVGIISRILKSKTDFLVDMLIGHLLHTLEAGETLDGVIIKSVLEIQRAQQFEHVRVTGHLDKRQAIGHIQGHIVHHSDKLTAP